MNTKTAEAERLAAAKDDVNRAVETILLRGGDPAIQTIEVLQAYLGRGWYPLADPHCTEHPSIKKPCPLCPRTPEDSEDA